MGLSANLNFTSFTFIKTETSHKLTAIMTSILPPFPRFVMTIFEPISLIAGCAAPFVSASYFVSEQIPNSPNIPLDANTSMIAYQLGNIYLLLAMVGIAILYTTTEAAVVRNYVIALWLADISHWGLHAMSCLVRSSWIWRAGTP